MDRREQNDPACLRDGGPACGSLDYALSNVTDCLMVRINSSLNLTTSLYISDVYGLVIAGQGTETIACEAGAGIYFERANDTSLEGISFSECSVAHPSAVLSPTQDLFYPNVSSAMYYEECLNINIANCNFTSSMGSGVTIFDSGGQVTITNSNFVNNSDPSMSCSTESKQGRGCYNISVGLEIKMTYCKLKSECRMPQPQSVFNSYGNYTIKDCLFSGNNNSFYTSALESEAILSYNVHRTLSHGGGLEIRLEGMATGNVFDIDNCKFENNTALWGGGLEVGIGEDCSNNTVSVSSTLFSQNSALVGGALRMGVFPPTTYDGYGYEEKNNVFNLFNCTFEGNTAVSAGAISYIANSQLSNLNLSHLVVTKTHFNYNQASDSGAAVAVTGWTNEIGGFPTYVEFTDCSFFRNKINFHVDVSKIYGIGVVNTEKIPIKFNGNTTFMQNAGSALVISSTVVYLNDNVEFSGNWALNGAGIFLTGLAWINLDAGVRITFADNRAYLYGGAIYSAYAIPQVHNSSRYCMFKYSNRSADISEWDAVINFRNNVAKVAGRSIFETANSGCHKNNETGAPFSDFNVFRYYTDLFNGTFDEVATPPYGIDFEYPAVVSNGIFSTNITLGQSFHLHPITSDYFGSPTSSYGVAFLICNPQDHACNTTTLDSDFTLAGNRLIQLNNSDTMSSFTVQSSTNSEQKEAILFLLTNTLPSAMGFLHINVTPCNLGYLFDRKTGKCECMKSEYVSCDVRNIGESCIKYGYWIGSIGNGEYTVQHCTNNVCKYSNGVCPVGPCTQELQSYCHLPTQNSDDLCQKNRGGILCSRCKKGYTFTPDALQCVPENTCSPGNTILLFFLHFIYMVILITIFLVAVALGMQLGSGQLYCLIYYFSVLQYLTRNNYPSLFLSTVTYFFVGFLNIDPKFLGLVPLCVFSSDFSPLNLKVLEYSSPLIMLLAILALIFVTRRYPRIGTKISFNGTKALCILLYLSLTSLAEISLNILDFIQLGEESDIRVAIDPNIRYFSFPHHTFHALLAITVLLIIIVPFVTLLLFAPCLARVHRLNFTRIKPIVDEYQACYHEDYRWFAGFYPAIRVFVFLFSLIIFGEFGSIFFLQMISIAILATHASIQPYRQRWLNILDTILLSDLAIYSLFNGSTANVVLDAYSTILRSMLIHLLILTPVFYFLGLTAYNLKGILQVLHKCCTFFNIGYRRGRFETSQTHANIDSVLRATLPPSEGISEQEREPLIFGDADSSHYHHTTMPAPQEPSTQEPSKTSQYHTPWYRRFSRATKPLVKKQFIDSNAVNEVREEISASVAENDVYRNTNFSKSSVKLS